MGIFDEKKPFDFNGDGKMSVFEKAKKEAYFMHVIGQADKEGSESFANADLMLMNSSGWRMKRETQNLEKPESIPMIGISIYSSYILEDGNWVRRPGSRATCCIPFLQ